MPGGTQTGPHMAPGLGGQPQTPEKHRARPADGMVRSWGQPAPTPVTCVVGRAQAGVVGGPGHAGAPVLTAVLLAGVTDGVAARALKTRCTQAPTRQNPAFLRVIPPKPPVHNLGTEHACTRGLWGAGSCARLPCSCPGSGVVQPGRELGEDAELPRQRAERGHLAREAGRLHSSPPPAAQWLFSAANCTPVPRKASSIRGSKG